MLSELRYAVERGNVQEVIRLLSECKRINDKIQIPEENYSRSLLQYSVNDFFNRNPEDYLYIIAYLLDNTDIDVNQQTHLCQWSALHRACYYNLLPIVKLLIEKGKADTELKTIHYNTPLHFASMSGNIEVTRYLIQKCVSLNTINIKYFTPLHKSIQHRNKSVTKLLIMNDAKIDLRASPRWYDNALYAHYVAECVCERYLGERHREIKDIFMECKELYPDLINYILSFDAINTVQHINKYLL